MAKPSLTDAPRSAIPPANQPGHHPEVEQDKPLPSRRFDFEFHPLFEKVARLAGITPTSASVAVRAHEVEVDFGPWSMRFDRDEVVSAEVTGPYQVLKVIGPPHLSLADRGITFATNPKKGVCIRLAHPQPGIEPLGVLRHPSLTVTVDDPEGLVELLSA